MRTVRKSLPEVGRIRIGDRQLSQNGKLVQHKLQEFRLTSSHKYLLELAAEQWGGDLRPWQGEGAQPNQYELYTKANQMEVWVPTDMALSRCYERWVASGCEWRCDGTTVRNAPLNPKMEGTLCQGDAKTDTCPCGAARVVRLSLILPTLPGMCLWRLETKGWYASSEFEGSFEMFRDAGLADQLLEGSLRLEVRKDKRITLEKGKQKNVVREYVVPVFIPKHTPYELRAAAQQHAILASQNRQQRAITAANDLFGDGAGERLLAAPVPSTVSQETVAALRDVYRECRQAFPSDWLPHMALEHWGATWEVVKLLPDVRVQEGIDSLRGTISSVAKWPPQPGETAESWMQNPMAAGQPVLDVEGQVVEATDDIPDVPVPGEPVVVAEDEVRMADGSFAF